MRSPKILFCLFSGLVLAFATWASPASASPATHVVSPGQSIQKAVDAASPGDTVVSPPGEAHTVGPAGDEDVEMVAELRPALTYEQFIERSFALDRAGHVNAKGRGNPLRMATARPLEAEFFLPRIPIGLQRALLRALDWLGRRLPGPRD